MDWLNWLYERWMDMSVFGQLIVILFIILIIYATIIPYVKDIMELFRNIYNSLFKKEINIISEIYNEKEKYMISKQLVYELVKNHELMNFLKRFEIEIQTKDFGDKNRNKIYKLILIVQMDNTKKHFFDLVERYDIDKLDKVEFKRIVYELLTNIISDTNDKLRLELGNEIFNLVLMDPVKGVRKWEEFSNKVEWAFIEDLFNIKYIEFNHQKLHFILSTKYTTLSVLFSGIEKRFSNFNGELDELIKKYDWK